MEVPLKRKPGRPRKHTVLDFKSKVIQKPQKLRPERPGKQLVAKDNKQVNLQRRPGRPRKQLVSKAKDTTQKHRPGRPRKQTVSKDKPHTDKPLHSEPGKQQPTSKYLSNWTLRLIRNRLRIEGDLLDDTQLQDRWMSSTIVSRTGLRTVRTKSTEYILEGDMLLYDEIPGKIKEEFVHGFPEDWRKLIEEWKSSNSREENMEVSVLASGNPTLILGQELQLSNFKPVCNSTILPTLTASDSAREGSSKEPQSSNSGPVQIPQVSKIAPAGIEGANQVSADSDQEGRQPLKRGRGRPRKKQDGIEGANQVSADSDQEGLQPLKRGRGRPRKKQDGKD